MTADEMQHIATRLSNSSWCRHWLNFLDSGAPVIMAVQCRNEEGDPIPIADFASHGLELSPSLFKNSPAKFFYIAVRTNPDGTLYESKLF